jgi:molybdenum cofactor cytidylyltransferase
VFVIGRGGESPLADEVERHGGTLVLNRDPDRGQLSSIQVGLEAAEAVRADAIMVLPVDVPLLSTPVLTLLMRAADEEGVAIARTTCRGRHGHPVLFTRAVFDELRVADPDVGAREVVRADPRRVRDVEVEDPAVIVDVDTPEDYRRAFGREL